MATEAVAVAVQAPGHSNLAGGGMSSAEKARDAQEVMAEVALGPVFS